MFNWNLLFILVAVSGPGALFAARGGMGTIERFIENTDSDQKLPPKNMLLILTVVQSLVLVAIAAAVGTALFEGVGLSAPAFEAAAAGEPIGAEIISQLKAAWPLAVLGALVFVGAYYGYFRRKLDAETVQVTEVLRGELGYGGRIFYGAIVEEILVRWGLMTLFVWILSLLIDPLNAVVYWIAIVLAGLLFALGHVPGSVAAGAKRTRMFYAATLGLNGWASLVFGWLFWQEGLVAAIFAHAVLHTVWAPIEKRVRTLA
jgi:hypothetical protein